MRIYSDERVARTLRAHYQEKLPELMTTICLQEVVLPESAARAADSTHR
jgi:hypothetical protein